MKKKDIKFKDERLNYLIDLIYQCKDGKKYMDYFLSCLTDEAVKAIDSKRYVYAIPGNKNYYIEFLMDDCFDPSFNGTSYLIGLVCTDFMLTYNFNVSYMHNKSYGNLGLCCVQKITNVYDEDGNCIEKKCDNDDTIVFSILNDECKGLVTDYGFPEVKKSKTKYCDVDVLLDMMKSNLKDRKYYQKLDKEVCKKYYKNKFLFYSLKDLASLKDYNEKMHTLNDYAHDVVHLKEEDYDPMQMSPLANYNTLSRSIAEQYKDGISFMCPTYEKWCKDNGLMAYDSVDYNEWLECNEFEEEIVVEEDVITETHKENNKYEVYNPNRYRYEDDEEDEVIINKNRR